MNDTSHSQPAIAWIGDEAGYLELIDQTLLPSSLTKIQCQDISTVWEAIKMLRVRGAPAIGIAAAYGVVLSQQGNLQNACDAALQAIDHLATSRPTAVNLFWSLDRMRTVVHQHNSDDAGLAKNLLNEARQIHDEDRQMCHAIGRHGAELIADGSRLITHCNAGGLATAEYGTALSVMFTCQDQGKSIQVFADETRPLWQGARLTAWELEQRGIPVTLICDSMAAHVMQTQKIDAIIVGADRITMAGDVANKIGTYGLAVAAKHHSVPFYVAAPSSTFDQELVDGRDIPIERRSASEITQPYGQKVAPENIDVYNPAFDVTPAELVSALITERGIIQPVTEANVRQHFEGPSA